MPNCEECNGHGMIGHGHANDPDEKFNECEYCGGSGERDLDFKDLDGVRVKIIANGIVGECTLFADGTASVTSDNGREYNNLGFDELELIS